MRVQHQRQQAERLALIGQQRGEQPPQPDRLVGQVAPPCIGAFGIGPALGIGGIDRIEHRIEPLAQLSALGDVEGNAGFADLHLGARQALAHRRRRHEKGRRNGRRIEAEHDLQHQRRAHTALDAGVRAGEQQAEAPIGDRAAVVVHREVGEPLQLFGDGIVLPPPARRIDEAPPRHREQPCIRVERHAALRPFGERGGEGVGQRILRAGHVARARGEKGHQLAVAAPRGGLGGARCIARVVRHGAGPLGINRCRPAVNTAKSSGLVQ